MDQTGEQLLRADLHVHTCYSIDCGTPLERIVDHCLRIGINCIAIVDHNTIAGALKLKETAPFKVIVGEEILTRAGELMGLFLTEEVPKGLPPEEAIARIRSQGGLVGIPHPFGRLLFGNPNKRASRSTRQARNIPRNIAGNNMAIAAKAFSITLSVARA